MRDFQGGGRSAAIAADGMIATSHPDAARVGLDILREGGSAADAALAASAVLAVAEPQNGGIGGDTFYMHSDAAGQVSAYNGSGRTPMALDPVAVSAVGQESVHSVTVPGAVDAMLRLHADHCRLPLDRLLAPAIAMARDGWLVQPRLAWDWQYGRERLAGSATGAAFWARDVVAGSRIASPALARTLEGIARDGGESFYRGEVAESIVATLRGLGGAHALQDFAGHRGEAVTPIRTAYRGLDILECPPNGQGLTVLLMLNLLSTIDMAQVWHDPVALIHLIAEVTRLGYGERDHWIGDPAFATAPVADLLQPAYADGLRTRIDRSAPGAWSREPLPEHKDTVYLACVDRDGNAVSFINSIFTDFGSTIYDEASGVLLHNRGASFSVTPGHVNALDPGKRPMHTIIPGLAMRDGKPVMPFGVMGGHYQATGQVVLLSAMLDAGLDPQQALELPRHFATMAGLELETDVPDAVAQALAAMGHEIVGAARPMGGGQAIWMDTTRGVLVGGTDPRKDGLALGY
jgi:gamma-glutamyltranspeptidase/glutathione hydrolase